MDSEFETGILTGRIMGQAKARALSNDSAGPALGGVSYSVPAGVDSQKDHLADCTDEPEEHRASGFPANRIGSGDGGRYAGRDMDECARDESEECLQAMHGVAMSRRTSPGDGLPACGCSRAFWPLMHKIETARGTFNARVC